MITILVFPFGPQPFNTVTDVIAGLIGLYIGVGSFADAVRGASRLGFLGKGRLAPTRWYGRAVLVTAGTMAFVFGVVMLLRGLGRLR